MGMIKKIDIWLQKWFHAQGYIRALEKLLSDQISRASKMEARAEFWQGEFEKMYDVAVSLRKELRNKIASGDRITFRYDTNIIPPCCNGKDCACGGRNKRYTEVIIKDNLPVGLDEALTEYLEKKCNE